MQNISKFKMLFKTFFVAAILLFSVACKTRNTIKKNTIVQKEFSNEIVTGASNYNTYLPFLKNKRIGVVTNQTGIVDFKNPETLKIEVLNTVDFLLRNKIDVVRIFSPEHGFRGTADAGEHVVDGKDARTGLSVISLYGDNKKPRTIQLEEIEILVFDLQDVGVRFYTYISTLHYVMESCAENNIPLIILDRPNPNGGMIDGPVLEKEFSSFVGMHPVPIVYGMTIGEYAKMINGEKWLKNGISCNLLIIPNKNYKREMPYNLPIKPSPNLPNSQAINLYPSLCLFEGTNISVGRGTEKQFQVYGSPFLPKTVFNFTPIPNFGAKDPLYKNEVCNGEDLSKIQKLNGLELKWLLKTYLDTPIKSSYFNSFFTKLAGTKKLQQQIEENNSEVQIRATWQQDIEKFKKIRKKYLIY